MKKDLKELLIKDLCARLPYDVAINCTDEDCNFICYLTTAIFTDIQSNNPHYEYKPYLFPMSSMTEEQKEELLEIVVGKKGSKYFKVLSDGSICSTDAKEQDLNNFVMHIVNFDRKTTASYIDWLNKNHFDYRGLIPKGLALDATNLNIY